MPPVPLPADFQDHLNTTDEKTFKFMSGRSSKSTIGPNGRDRADVYVGLLFDGYRAYDNFTSSLPGIQFQFFLPPIINSGSVLTYNPHRQAEIEILVSRYVDIAVRDESLLVHDSSNDGMFTLGSRWHISVR
jgi:hypothetical protein